MSDHDKYRKSDDRSDGNFESRPLPKKIGNSLKKIYDDVLNEPVPDDFLALLAKADKNKKNG
ncbi:NepR family anti-sigma factor [Robiginitomaculum antarcticum]|uniref:NepR family anti-sigma factor n=1 Tax=Robiginitomaculum antarcticum TaxID=437507 RepID=UPI000476C9E5|nr:NepR family anti-sigma factor [Robiginitomaculum antarcticum]